MSTALPGGRFAGVAQPRFRGPFAGPEAHAGPVHTAAAGSGTAAPLHAARFQEATSHLKLPGAYAAPSYPQP